MMGREIYSNPYILADVDTLIFNKTNNEIRSRFEVIEAMTTYIQHEVARGARVWHIARHMLGLFQGQPGGKIWRRYLSQNGTGKNNNPLLLLEAYEQVLAAQAKVKLDELTFGQKD
jgi:tRNA-dihydrouridine synthase A